MNQPHQQTEPDEWDNPPHDQRALTAHQPTTWPKQISRSLSRQWRPQTLPVPSVDPDLPYLNGIERSAEVCRFTASKMEHALSPMGCLREFLKVNCRLAIALAVPLYMVAPLVTLAFKQLETWITQLSQTMSSFVLFPLSVILSILLVYGMIQVGRAILEARLRNQYQRSRQRDNESYY